MRGVFYFYYMHDFLKDVTKDIFNNNVNISDCIIILPNKRSGFFLKEEINFQVSNTIFSPKIYEIDDFMSLVSGVEKISNTDIIFELFKTYCESKSKKKAENFELKSVCGSCSSVRSAVPLGLRHLLETSLYGLTFLSHIFRKFCPGW